LAALLTTNFLPVRMLSMILMIMQIM
jgi:hypothetical protein